MSAAAVDANVLVYAAHDGHPLQGRARALLQGLIDDGVLFLPWPVLLAFMRISTHPRVFENPLTHHEAMTMVERLVELPSVRTLCETPTFWRSYRAAVTGVRISGNLVSDAHVAALLLANGVPRLYTNDTDFLRFEFLDVRNPFR